MTDTQRFVRRNRVDERTAVGIAAVAGVVAAFSGGRPTGSTVIDVVLVVLTVGAVVWASASAPWWAPASAAGVAAVVALQPILAIVGAGAFVAGLAIGLRQRDQAELRAVVAALALNVLIRSELDGFFGLSAIIGVSVGVALFVVGLRRRPSAIRRVGWISSATVAGVMVLAVLGAGLSAMSARSDLSRGSQQARLAVDALDDGSYQEASALFGDASTAFDSADRRLGGPLGKLAVLIPGVAQNVSAGSNLAAAAAEASGDVASALERVDVESLRVVQGVIDLDAMRAVEQPLVDVQASLTELRDVVEEVRSPWLLGRIQTELDELGAEFDDNQPRLDNAIEAVRLAPQMLGSGGQRRYLIMFTSPAEARGVTGFFGNYAEVTITDGLIDVTEFGRRSDLEAFIGANGAVCTGCPQEFVDRYGRYSLADAIDLSVRERSWSNLTMPAHFPYIAEVAEILYPQSGRPPIDGVIAMDPYVLQALMAYTGRIEVPELGITVEPDNAAQFILEDQYLLAGDDGNDDRIDAIDTLGQQVISSLLAGALPVPSTLARDLGPLAAEQRLLVWTSDPAEQALFERIGIDGALPTLGADGGFGVAVNNGGHSKIDVYLERDTTVTIETDDDGRRTLVAEVTLTNTAPNGGLPRVVIGNDFDLPVGTNRYLISFFGPTVPITVTRDGEPVAVETLPEAGWAASTRSDDLASGASVTYRIEYPLGPNDDDVDAPVEWMQPWARQSP